jgi:hypothetical protein
LFPPVRAGDGGQTRRLGLRAGRSRPVAPRKAASNSRAAVIAQQDAKMNAVNLWLHASA